MNFQRIIATLNDFWAAHGCVIWQPHNEHVGAGTSNPATVLRVLGPEPWNVAYLEPSDRPTDGRYGENPNRWYEYYQYQVILKPDPGNPIELYLSSLRALGINQSQHDVRFVEDNWQSPSLGAWGLGWEVWLDGLEITQFTYFQQACGLSLAPVSVEITYGLERIAMFLQSVSSIAEIQWLEDITYGDLHLPEEVDYCRYNFDVADLGRLNTMYNLFEAEADNALSVGLVLPAHDHLLRCSHTFNILDARGAIGVTQRAQYFARMRDLARQVADAYLKQREALGWPMAHRAATQIPRINPIRTHPVSNPTTEFADFLLEIGTEELPAEDQFAAREQLLEILPRYLVQNRLNYQEIQVETTPRRLVIYLKNLATIQQKREKVIKGPAVAVAFDNQGNPTAAANGFARSVNLPLSYLIQKEFEGKKYLIASISEESRPGTEILKEIVPQIIGELKFQLAMRWSETPFSFSRPIRWIVALFGEGLIDVEFAGIPSDRITYGNRWDGSPAINIPSAESYSKIMHEAHVILLVSERRKVIQDELRRLGAEINGEVEENDPLINEVENLIEYPIAIRGAFDPAFLALPSEVLVTVMKKHQRYFPLWSQGRLLPYFITIANGGETAREVIQMGNEQVLKARFSDAKFFFEMDGHKPLSTFLPKLANLTFQERLGSYAEKSARVKRLALILARFFDCTAEEQSKIAHTADFAKADLVTNLVIELPALQGTIGKYYAEMSGEDADVARAIEEHYLPRFAGDKVPDSSIGTIVGLADRLDSLVALFAAGLAPSGTSDPYGVRRIALGVLQLLLEKNLSLPLSEILQQAGELEPLPVDSYILAEIQLFLRKRLQGLLVEKGFGQVIVEAVLNEQANDPALAYTTLICLAKWIDQPEFERLLQAYTRTWRIVRDHSATPILEPALLNEPAAERLFSAYLQALARQNGKQDINLLLRELMMLTEPINTFFEEILVLHEDKILRNARLALLQRIAELPRGIVDLKLLAQ